MMSIYEKKEKLLNQEMSVADLTFEEVIKIKESCQRDLSVKRQTLNEVNHKIKKMKEKIDNWSN